MQRRISGLYELVEERKTGAFGWVSSSSRTYHPRIEFIDHYVLENVRNCIWLGRKETFGWQCSSVFKNQGGGVFKNQGVVDR